MSQKLLLACLTCCCAASTAFAQQVCTIEGTFSNNKMRYEEKPIEKVYLSRMDEMENLTVVDSVQVSGNTFTLRHALTDYNGPEIYLLTGFDNGSCAFFVEPGTVKLGLDAAFPSGGMASGTKTNDLYMAYRAVGAECTRMQLDSINSHVAARLARALDNWRRYTPELARLMHAALTKVARTENLSAGVSEVVEKALNTY